MINTVEKTKQERGEGHWAEGGLQYDMEWSGRPQGGDIYADLKAVREQVTQPISAT